MYAYVVKDCSPIPSCIMTISVFHNALLRLTDSIHSQILAKFKGSAPYYSPTLFRMFPMARYNKKDCVLTLCILSSN